MKPFKSVQVGSFFMAMQYLHDTVHGAEEVSLKKPEKHETVVYVKICER